MYAMLTGCLPYTVEPFNITALHAKMLENKMNPIPEHLSSGEFSRPHHMIVACGVYMLFTWQAYKIHTLLVAIEMKYV